MCLNACLDSWKWSSDSRRQSEPKIIHLFHLSSERSDICKENKIKFMSQDLESGKVDRNV